MPRYRRSSWRARKYLDRSDPLRDRGDPFATDYTLQHHITGSANLGDETEVATLVNEAVSRGFWRSAVKLLDCKLTAQQQKLILVESSKRASEHDIFTFNKRYVNTDCTSEVVQILIDRGNVWDTLRRMCGELSECDVKKLALEASRSDRCRDWKLQEILERCFPRIAFEKSDMETITQHLCHKQAWGVIARLLPSTATDLSAVMVSVACRLADEKGMEVLLEKSPRAHQDCVVKQCIEKGAWGFLAKNMKPQSNVFSYLFIQRVKLSDSASRLIVEEAMQKVGDISDEDFHSIMVHCANDQVERVLPKAIRRRQWQVVENLLNRRPVDTELLAWILGEAIDHTDENFCLQIIRQFPSHHYCKDSEHNTQSVLKLASCLPLAVTKGMWKVVASLLTFGNLIMTDTTRGWVVEEALARAGDDQLAGILVYCVDDQLELVATEAVRKGFWKVLLGLLKRGLPEALVETAVEEASKHAESSRGDFLPFCTDAQLDSVTKTLLDRRLWDDFPLLLSRGVSQTLLELVRGEAMKHADDRNLSNMVPLLAGTDEAAKGLLGAAVERGLWRSVCELLKRGVDAESEAWAVDQASQRDRCGVLSSIIQFCSDDQIETVLLLCMKRHQYEAIGMLLSRPLTDQQNSRLLQALERLGPVQVNHALQELTELENWKAIGFFLQSDHIDAENRASAVREALDLLVLFNPCRNEDFIKIVKKPPRELLMQVLYTCVKRNLQQAALDTVERLCQDSDVESLLTNHHPALLVMAMDLGDSRQELVVQCLRQFGSSPLLATSNNTQTRTPTSMKLSLDKCALRRAALENDSGLVRVLNAAGVYPSACLHELHADFEEWSAMRDTFDATFQDMTRTLQELTSTPPSLKSSCRGVISRSLGLGRRRDERVRQLPLPAPLAGYLLYSDLANLPKDETDMKRGQAATAVRELYACLFPPSPPTYMDDYDRDDYSDFDDYGDYDDYDYNHDWEHKEQYWDASADEFVSL